MQHCGSYRSDERDESHEKIIIMKFIKDAAYWIKKIEGIERAIKLCKVEISSMREQLKTCFDEGEKNLLEYQIESFEAETASLVKGLKAAKEGKFA